MADQEDATREDAKPPSPKDVVKVVAELGYVYKAPEGGSVSDERLTQVDDETKGFEWKGQENYDAVAAACALYCKTRLVLASGLMETALGEARCWAHPNDAGPNAPIIFLVCGSFPGGSAGVWGRSLCVNATLREGGMFDYIERCRNELGANVVVADPNVSEEAGRIVAGSEMCIRDRRGPERSYHLPGLRKFPRRVRGCVGPFFMRQCYFKGRRHV